MASGKAAGKERMTSMNENRQGLHTYRCRGQHASLGSQPPGRAHRRRRMRRLLGLLLCWLGRHEVTTWSSFPILTGYEERGVCERCGEERFRNGVPTENDGYEE